MGSLPDAGEGGDVEGRLVEELFEGLRRGLLLGGRDGREEEELTVGLWVGPPGGRVGEDRLFEDADFGALDC